MVRLNDLDVTKCPDCGKLFQSEPGRTKCRVCAGDAGPAEGVSATPNFTWQDVYEVLEHPVAVHPDGKAMPCVRCGQRPALDDSEFCLHCHVDLQHDLGDASRELFTQMEVVEELPRQGPTVASALSGKRERAPHSHLNMVSPPSLKKYG